MLFVEILEIDKTGRVDDIVVCVLIHFSMTWKNSLFAAADDDDEYNEHKNDVDQHQKNDVALISYTIFWHTNKNSHTHTHTRARAQTRTLSNFNSSTYLRFNFSIRNMKGPNQDRKNGKL